jgi:hypothetical protein
MAAQTNTSVWQAHQSFEISAVPRSSTPLCWYLSRAWNSLPSRRELSLGAAAVGIIGLRYGIKAAGAALLGYFLFAALYMLVLLVASSVRKETGRFDTFVCLHEFNQNSFVRICGGVRRWPTHRASRFAANLSTVDCCRRIAADPRLAAKEEAGQGTR